MAKPKTAAPQDEAADPDALTVKMQIRISERMQDRIRVAAFKRRQPPAVFARLLIEAGLKLWRNGELPT